MGATTAGSFSVGLWRRKENVGFVWKAKAKIEEAAISGAKRAKVGIAHKEY